MKTLHSGGADVRQQMPMVIPPASVGAISTSRGTAAQLGYSRWRGAVRGARARGISAFTGPARFRVAAAGAVHAQAAPWRPGCVGMRTVLAVHVPRGLLQLQLRGGWIAQGQPRFQYSPTGAMRAAKRGTFASAQT